MPVTQIESKSYTTEISLVSQARDADDYKTSFTFGFDGMVVTVDEDIDAETSAALDRAMAGQSEYVAWDQAKKMI